MLPHRKNVYNSVLKKNEEFPRVVRRSNDAINFLSTEEFTKKKSCCASLSEEGYNRSKMFSISATPVVVSASSANKV